MCCWQEKRNLNKDYKDHIVVMELHILDGINWRMRAVIAICFVSFFIRISTVEGISQRVANEIIIQAQGGKNYYRTEINQSILQLCIFSRELRRMRTILK